MTDTPAYDDEDETIELSLTPEEQEELFQEILYVYDLVDNMAATLEQDNIKNHAEVVVLATPLITQITNSTNIIAAFYAEIINKKRAITPDVQDTLESAFRNVFTTLKEFLDEIEEKYLLHGGSAA